MLKKNLLRIMISALALSTCGSVFAMVDEDNKRTPPPKPTAAFFSDSNADVEDRVVLPLELQIGFLSFVPGEDLLNNVALVSKRCNEFVKDRLLQRIIIAQIFPNGKLANTIRNLKFYMGAEVKPIEDSDAKFFIGRFQEALIMHLEYPCTLPFIERVFNADVINQTAHNNTPFSIHAYESVFFPLGILAAPAAATAPSTVSADQERSLKKALIALFERNPAFENYDANFCNRFPYLNYESHFKPISRFMEGMTEEQQKTTVSLLLPHVNSENFGNFYPAIFIDGFTHNLAYSAGDQKIKWLRRKLKERAYF